MLEEDRTDHLKKIFNAIRKQRKLLTQYGRDSVTCTSLYWVTNTLAEFIQIICFYLLVKKIYEALERFIETEMKEFGCSRERFENQID